MSRKQLENASSLLKKEIDDTFNYIVSRSNLRAESIEQRVTIRIYILQFYVTYLHRLSRLLSGKFLFFAYSRKDEFQVYEHLLHAVFQLLALEGHNNKDIPFDLPSFEERILPVIRSISPLSSTFTISFSLFRE